MKNRKTIVIILLNVLFCTITLWLFVRNSLLRPSAGSDLKEFISGLLFLGTLYLNYFLLYPKLYQRYSHIVYWIVVLFIALLTALIDMAIANPYIVSRNAEVIEFVGPFNFYSKIISLIAGRNFALNFLPFLIKERQHYQQALDKEVRIVYRDVRKLDVVDEHNDIQLVPIEDIFYCHQQGNFTEIFMVQNRKYTRLGSMRHLEQLFGEEDFIRLTTTVLVPFRYVESCQEDMVVMKKMPWEEEPTAFKLEAKTKKEIAKRILESIQSEIVETSDENIPEEPSRPKAKRKPATPPEEKINEVFLYIKKHPNCNSADIMSETKFSLSTVERCLSELKKQGCVEYVGSKKTGGYLLFKTQSR